MLISCFRFHLDWSLGHGCAEGAENGNEHGHEMEQLVVVMVTVVAGVGSASRS